MLRFLRSKGKRTATIWWVLIVVTVVTFLGGFVFILGSGLNSSYQAKVSGAVGTVNGKPISRTDYQNALADQRAAYRDQYGSDPADRDLKMVEIQAWRSLVVQRLMNQQARQLGLEAHDHEVVVSLQNNPPPMVLSSPAFQTDGKFDPAKYQAILMDPNNVSQVAALEEMTRRQLPMRKLQERLASSIKLSEQELNAYFRDRFESVAATVVHVAIDPSEQVPAPTDADMERVYQQYRGKFATGALTQLEMLMVPKALGEDEIRSTQELAQSLADRARRGEDFANLVRDYSEGPATESGGVIDREFKASDLGPELESKLGALEVGGISDAVRDGGRFLVFKLMDRTPDPDGGPPSLKLAEILIKVRGNESKLLDQYNSLAKLRDQAEKSGLGKAAAAQGMATTMTRLYSANDLPQELFDVPEAADWGVTAPEGKVSPVFEGTDAFAIAQVAVQRPAGVPPRQQITPQLRQVAELDARVEKAKPQADAIREALASGRSIEQAAAQAGISPYRIEAMSRLQPDQRLAAAPQVVGALFAAPVGQVVGPIRNIDGWYFARVDRHTQPDAALFQQVRTQLSNDLLQRRQQTFLGNYVNELRANAEVKDLRSEALTY